jgi:hypothetical protein
LEPLEDRCLLSVSPTDFRPINEVGNNQTPGLENLGTAGTDLLRLSPVAYADGISAPSQPNTLSPRQISNDLSNQSNPIFSFADNLGPPQSQSLSDFAYVWGQFIDHDMDLTPTQNPTTGESFNIPADPTRPNDPMGVESFLRSVFDPNTGTSNPRQQINAVTSFLDLSNVYGSTQVVADALRTFQGGQLKTSPGGLLPYDTTAINPLTNAPYFTQEQIAALNMANDAQQVPESSLFAAGDVRANENIELTAMQTLFVDNHNRIASELATMNPADFGFTKWTDENLYQEARKLNIAEEQMITYNEFLPAILGPNALPAYQGYNAKVDPSIATEFSTVAFRFGHSLLSNGVGRVNNDGTQITDVNANGSTVNLAEDFFRPDLINPNGVTVPLVDRNGNPDPHTSSNIGAILKADASNTANEMDLQAIDEVRSLLFGIPNAPGTDLIARDIQRARDDGIGTYNQLRVAFGLPAVTSFAQITSNKAVQQQLQATYGSVDKIDPLVGMFAEDHVAGGDVGPTIKAVLVDQFSRLETGDRYFYLNESFNQDELNILQQGDTLAKVIETNTSITNLQGNVFFFKVSISGTVFNDLNGNGVQNASEGPLSYRLVELEDTSGNVLATTRTDSNGHYSFTDQTGIPGTGQFQVVAADLPNGWEVTSPNPFPVAITAGGQSYTVNIGEVKHIRNGSTAAAALASSSGPGGVLAPSAGPAVSAVDTTQTATLATALADSTGSGTAATPQGAAPAGQARGAGSSNSASNQNTLVFLAKRGKASSSVDPSSNSGGDVQTLSGQ